MSDWRIKGYRISPDLVLAFSTAALLVLLSLIYGSAPLNRRPGDHRPLFHFSCFPNLTHAPGLVGLARGDFQRELPDFAVEPKLFNAGPEEMEALLAGEVDVAYVGPSPAINTYLKSNGKALRILAGACSGGASLLARSDNTIANIADLGHKRVAVPQLGGTQDVSLRHFLDLNGLAPLEDGGTVQIIAAKNPDILAMFLQHQIDAAWVPEPWASRLKHDGGARTVIDERELWPGKAFTTTVLVARTEFADHFPRAIEAVLRAHVEIIKWINENPKPAKLLVNEQLKKWSGKALGQGVLADSWAHVTFTSDENRPSILTLTKAAERAGYLKGKWDISGVFDSGPLKLATQVRRIEVR